MTPQTKKYLIYTGLALVGTASLIVAKNKYIRNPKIRKNLDEALKGGAGQYGTLEDIEGFKGKAYQSIANGKNVIKFEDPYAKTLADTIDKAWGVVNDDEESVYQVFRTIKDNYELSQVAQSYLTWHKTPLLAMLKSRLSDSERDVIYKIAKQYKPYRLK